MATVGRIGGQVLKDDLLRQNINLDFRNQSSSTPVLKLDVVNDRVGINTTSPSQQIEVNGTAFGGNIIATNSLTAAGNMSITTNGFSALSGNITISGSTGVYASGVGTNQLIVKENRIYSYVSDAPLSLETNGTGTIELKTDTNVTGNLHATGNITANGNIIIGDANDDNLILSGEVNSDIIPDIDITYNLGSIANKKWANTHTNVTNVTDLVSNGFTVNNIDITQTQGNIFYVATNGSDSNVGDHNLDPFLTIGYALQAADASTGGPVTIHVSPGTYVETFPLTIPTNVTLQGHDMRNVIITPNVASQSNDAILLNGESTVENITIKDFFYNSGADTGYAFRFVSNATISTRSPYIRNCTVITKGSVTSSNDPRGYDQGDAGRGVLVDGASVTITSKEASMLFHATTFITPGQQGVTAKNGARIEWLNSFTYFSSIGIKTEQGSTGFAGQGAKFGAEMRCIGSACVYGNKGIDSDGAGSIVYLVDHNFAYIGAGKDITNDDTLHIQSNEITTANGATVSFTSLDQIGTYRVGSTLEVNQETGQTIISSSNFDFSSVDQLSISDGVQSVVLNSDRVQTDFIKFSGTTLESIVGNLELRSGLDTINISNNTIINANLDVTGNVTLGGELIRLGDDINDTIDFEADITGDLIPNFTSTYSLGSPTKHWNRLNAQTLFLDGITLAGNRISTDATNQNIELKSIGSQVRFESDLVVTGGLSQPNSGSSKNQFDGSLTVDNELTVANFFNINGLFTNQFTGKVTAQSLKSDNNTIFDDISIIQNNITTRNSNSNLILNPAGSGNVSILSNLSVFNLLAPNANISIGSASGLDKVVGEELLSQNIILTGDAVIEDIAIADNIISTRTSNSDLVLRANGSGSVRFQEDTIIEGDIITPATSSVATTSTNNLGVNTLIVQNLNSPNKNIIFEDVMFTGNKITTTNSNSNLTFDAIGSGVVKTKSRVGLSKNLEVTTGNTNFIGPIASTTLTVESLSTTTLTGVGTSIFEGISLSGNVISTKESNANLELRASGTGTVNIQDNFVITNGITGNDTTLGNLVVTNNSTASSGISVTGNFNTGTTATNFENIQIKDNYIQTTDSDSNLELRANGTGTVRVADNFNVTNTITSTVGNFSSLVSNGTANLDSITTGSLTTANQTHFEGITILGNVVTTKDSNANLELRASGTGKVNIVGNLTVTNNINVSGLTTAGTKIDVQNAFQTQNLISKNLDAKPASIDKIRIMGNHITTNVIDTDLQLRASGSGNINVPNNNVTISNNLTVNKLNAANINIQQDVDLGSLEVIGNINVNDNFIETTVSNSDLELRSNGSAPVFMGGIRIDDQITTVTGSLELTPTTNVSIQGTGSIMIPQGTTAQENASQTQGSIRYNNTANQFVGYGPTSSFVLSNALLSDDLLTGITVNNFNDINFNVAGNNVATFTSNNKAQINTSKILTNGFLISGNNIAPSNADTNIVLDARHARVAFDKLHFQDQYIHADGTGIVQFDNTGAGTVKFNQTTAILFPTGTTAQREPNPETGTARYNSQLEVLEVYTGLSWASAEGSSGSVSTADMEDLLNTYTIIFG